MAKLKFIEESLRDGQQSLWANRMTTASMLPATSMLNEAGFDKVNILSGSAFECCIAYINEDPWERMRLLCNLMPNPEIMVLVRSRHLFGWDRYPNDVIELFLKTLSNIGIDWILVFDALNDIRNMEWQCRLAKKVGMKSSPALTFTESPVHTDKYYASKAKALLDIGVDCVTFGDASGLLTPERTRSLIPALLKAIGNKADFGFGVHDSTGQSIQCLIEAMKAGAREFTSAAVPLSYGNSIAPTMEIVREAAKLGLETNLDQEIVERLDDYLYWAAYQEKREVGRPITYDPESYAKYVGHQIPGGMMSHLVSQLQDLGIEHRLPEVLEEAARVREELGWPVMVTPFSQFVGVQAVFNVIQEERYQTFPGELPLYARGYYGELAAPIDPNVLDRVLSGSGTEQMDALENMDDRMVDRLRKEAGRSISDEDLLMKLFCTPQNLEKFKKNKIALDPSASIETPLICMIKELSKRRDIKSFKMERSSTKLKMTF